MSFKLAFQAFFFGIVFTLVAIVVIFFKVLEKVEKKYAIRRAALEEQNQKFLNDVKRRKEGLSVSGIKNDDGSPKEGEVNVYGIPVNPPFDPTTAWLLDGKLHMQLGGKRSTNAAKYAYLTNNLLYFGSKKNASSMESFNIEGALLKKAQTETKLKAAIEVLHPSRPFCYPPRVDYFYLIFKSEKDMERWFFALLACGCAQHPTGAVAQVPEAAATVNDDEGSEGSIGSARSNSGSELHSTAVAGTGLKSLRTEVHRKGWLVVQKEDSKTSLRRFAVIDGQDLMLYESEKILSASADTINLNAQCEVVPYTQKRHKFALELRRKGMEIVPGIDYFTLVFESEMDRDVWQLALQATLQGSMRGSPAASRRASDASALTADKFRQASAASSSLIDQSAPLLPLSETRRKETVEWLNPLIARFFQNIRVNPSVTKALKEKMSKKLMQKVSEKKLNDYLTNLAVEEVDLGDAIPILQSAKLLEPRVPGEVSLDLSIVFRGQMRARISAQVVLPMISPISFSANASLTLFEGKVNINCPPFPAERFSFSFYSEPKTELTVHTFIGDKAWLNQLPRVNELIIARIRLSIVERLVAPNRRYARIPKSATSDELKTAFAAMLVAQGAPDPQASSAAPAAAASAAKSSVSGIATMPPNSRDASVVVTAPIATSTPNASASSLSTGSGLVPRAPSPEPKGSRRERISALLSTKPRKSAFIDLTEVECVRARKFFQRWFYKTQYRHHVRRKRLVTSLRDQERLYVASMRQAGELYGTPAFEPYTRMAEVAALFADMFMLLSYHQQFNENLFTRSLRWNVDSQVGDLMADLASFVKEEEAKYQAKYQHLVGTTLPEWNKSAPQRYAAFRAMRVGDLSLEDALAAPLQSVGRYLSWLEAVMLVTSPMHLDHALLDLAVKRFKGLAEGVAPHKFRNTLKNLFAHK